MASAVELVVERGPSVSTAEIAARAGVSKGAFQHHFASKNELLAAVVASGWNDLAERLEACEVSSTSPAARVRELVDLMWTAYQQPSCLAAFVISVDPGLGADLRVELSAGFHDVRCRLDERWEVLFADLDVSGGAIRAARRFARSHLLGMLTQRRLPHGEPPADVELDRLCDATVHLLHGQVLTHPAPITRATTESSST